MNGKITCLLSLLICFRACADGAGILPYSYGEDGNAYFLIGYEDFRVRGLGAWADYGGTMKGTDAKKEAGLEFAEETRRVFGNVDTTRTITQRFLDDRKKDLKKSRQYGTDHITSLAFDTTFGNFTYHQFLGHVDYVPADALEAAFKFPDWDKEYHLWIPAAELMYLVNTPAQFVALPQQYIANKPIYINPVTGNKHPTTNIYGNLVATLRRKDVQDFINTTVLQPIIVFLPYLSTSRGTTEFLFAKDGMYNLSGGPIPLRTMKPKDLFTTLFPTVPGMGQPQMSASYIGAPPLHELMYTVQIPDARYIPHLEKHHTKNFAVVEGQRLLAWSRQPDPKQKLDGYALPQTIYTLLHSMQGNKALTNIVQQQPAPQPKTTIPVTTIPVTTIPVVVPRVPAPPATGNQLVQALQQLEQALVQLTNQL